MKNRFFLKISSILLVLLLLSPLFCACQSAKPEPAPESIPSPLPVFNGEEIRFFASTEGMLSRSIMLGEDDDPTLAVNAATKKETNSSKKNWTCVSP